MPADRWTCPGRGQALLRQRDADVPGSDLACAREPFPSLIDLDLRHPSVHRELGWQVSAGYDLMNPSSAPAALTLLFPEELCQTGADCSPLRGMFQDLGTRLGSQLIEPLQAPGPGPGQGPAAPDLRPWTSSPGQAYQYPVKVPPKGPTHLSHEYRFDASTGREWWGVHYVSSAGRWGAPVEKVRFTVELKH